MKTFNIHTDPITSSDDSDHESELVMEENHYSCNKSEASNIQQLPDVRKKSFRFMAKVAEGVKFVVDSITGKLMWYFLHGTYYIPYNY